MSRTVIPVSNMVANAVTADPAGTAIDATNSHYVAPGVHPEEILIRVRNTTNATKVATLKAGKNPPADAAGQGDLAVSLTAGNVTPQIGWIGPVTSARFVQGDGSLNIDIGAGMTGDITVFGVPRTA